MPVLQLQIDLLRHGQGVIDLNPEIADGTFQLRMTEEQLNSAQVAGLAIDLRGLCTAH